MELALSLEKLNFIKLRELHRVACNAEDAQLADFIGESASTDTHALCLYATAGMVCQSFTHCPFISPEAETASCTRHAVLVTRGPQAVHHRCLLGVRTAR